ncbi:hypothetical protein HYH03_004332 [Edaphochlamys debaryana]|uniref:Uncharacterized protein n=1 Tax=Edaphochlamys debaryana TaxID=47281 RepID=A0A835YB52_9CHLO|nr:hypothetical protein HYH03_004332 [Edaphochlamys debaryana]|eukprot:KAG2497586.1 hypothetical protein HYH03_004332 [Edaphochlamys debaryana]
MTARSMRYMVADPKPQIKLVHRFKPGTAPGPDQAFWSDFVNKCRMAWGVFFPPPPQTIRSRRPPGIASWALGLGKVLPGGKAASASGSALPAAALSAKQVVLNRLQMVLIADRCGVSPETLLDMKAQTLTALAEYMGVDGAGGDLGQLEVQVTAVKPNGEKVTMTMGFSEMLADEQLRDPLQYHYQFEDPDDYFMPEDDDHRISEIAEAPAAGMASVRVAARPAAGKEAAE